MLSVSTLSGFGRSGSVVAAVRELGELGFEAVELSADAAAPDGLAAAALCREKRVQVRTIAAPFSELPWVDGDPTRDLASTDDARRRRSVAAVLAAVPAAAVVQAEAIVVRFGEMELAGESPDPEVRRATRDRWLDAAARSLFDLTRACPDVTFAVRTPGTWRGLPDPDEMEMLFDDAGDARVGYAHDVAAADRLGAAGLADPAAWLARHGPRAVRVVLSDRIGDLDRLPPGGGEVDWAVVAAGVAASMSPVLEVGANHSPAEIVRAAEFLRDRGIVG
ncbi:MAG: TIM barrel protein [Planctomycetota bacterium]